MSATAEQRRPPGRIAFLLSQVGAHVSERFAERCRELGLTPSEAAVLRLAGRTPGLSQRSLADRVGTAPSRMVALIDGLEERGLVARARSSTDRRNYELHLTADGQALLAALRQVAEAHESEILDGLTPEQTGHLAAALQTLIRAHHLDPEVHHRTRPRQEEDGASTHRRGDVTGTQALRGPSGITPGE
jgi:DNA-binding MarR family transcriptional regulator